MSTGILAGVSALIILFVCNLVELYFIQQQLDSQHRFISLLFDAMLNYSKDIQHLMRVVAEYLEKEDE